MFKPNFKRHLVLLAAAIFTSQLAQAETEELFGVPGPKLRYQTPVTDSHTYEVRGETYTTRTHEGAKNYEREGTASYYHSKFNGRRTSSGETYNSALYTAAHKTLPLNSYAVVTNLNNNRKVIVKINDRGPFHQNRLIDVSGAAAKELGITRAGTGRVKVEALHVDRKGKVSGAGAKTLAKTAKSEEAREKIKSTTNEKTFSNQPALSEPKGEWFKIKMLGLSKKQANQVVAKLARQNISAEAQQNGRNYEVHCGPLKTKEQTADVKARLHKIQSKQPLIVYSYNNP